MNSRRKFVGSLAPLMIVVIAFFSFGCSSSSAPEEPPDTTGPALSSVAATGINEVRVTFSEAVEASSAEEVANYGITQVPAKVAPWMAPPVIAQVSIAVVSASLESDGRTVVLATDPMDPFAAFELAIQGVSDLAGNTMTAINTAVSNEIPNGKIFTMAGTGEAAAGPENVDPLKSPLWLPQDLTFSPEGLPYIMDWNNHRVRVIQEGLIRTVLGTGILGDAEPGTATDVGLNHPTQVTFGADGYMYVAAWHNSKVLRVDLAASWCEPVVAEAGNRAFNGDGGPAIDADLDLPAAVLFDKLGNMYIADQANRRIRIVDTNGTINTWAGTGDNSYCGDGGPAIDACINGSKGQNAFPTNKIVFDAQENLYIADTMNHRVRVIDTNRIINTVAGNGFAEFSGDGGDATAAGLDSPVDVAIGTEGELYIADTENHVIRMVKNGIISTVAGQGRTAGFAGDGGRPTDAILNTPYGVAVDSDGNLYIADTKNHRIRVVYK